MANATVGTIQYDATINTDGMDKGASKINGIVGGIGKATAAVVVAGAVAVGALVGASVKAFADYEQMVGGVETLFKDSAGTVEAYAQNAYKTAGLSANEYMATVTSFSASLLQGLGGDTAKAAEIGNMAVTDMSDNANKFGTSIEMVQNAYQGFAKDNFTMLDNLKLGYGGTASEMARLVNDSGVMGESFKATAENVKDIPFDQLLLSINKVQTGLGITGTTAKEASSTIAGSFASVKAAWENVLTSFGSGNNEMIKASIDGLVESATNLITNLSVIIPNIIGGIGQLVTAFAAQLPALLTTLIPTLTSFVMTAVNVLVVAIPQFINAGIQLIVSLLQGIATTLPTIIPKIIEGVMSIINTIVTNLPLILDAGIQILMALIDGLVEAIPKLIPAVIEAMMQILTTLIEHLPEIIEGGVKLLVALVQGLADAIPTLVKFIPQIITTLVKVLTDPDMITLLLKAALDIIVAIVWGLIQAIPELIAAVPQLVGALVTAFTNIVSTIWQIGTDLVKGIWQGISDATQWILDQIGGFCDSVVGGIKDFFGINSPSKLFRDEIGKNLALGVGEGFTDGMGQVTKDMQNAMPTPSIDIGSVGDYQANPSTPQTVIVKLGEETIATRVIDLINDRTRLSGSNAILV